MKKYLFLLFLVLLCPVIALSADKVEINTASLEELDKITGIGPAIAQRIIDARPFSSVEDLLRVSGIGEKTLQKIKEQGLAYVGEESKITNPLNSAELQRAESERFQSETNSNDQNSKITTQLEEVGSPAGDPTSNASLAPAYPTGIFINEILASPEGADEENEWIELYSSNNFDVDLSGWKLQDIEGTQTTYIIPEGMKILSKSFLVFNRPKTKITLNNEGDGLKLLTPDNKIIDSISYTKAQINQSYNKTGSMWQWSMIKTPGTANIITTLAKNTPKNLPETENSDRNDIIEAGLAGISQGTSLNQDAKNLNPWFLFFTTLAVALISASAVLFIKVKHKT